MYLYFLNTPGPSEAICGEWQRVVFVWNGAISTATWLGEGKRVFFQCKMNYSNKVNFDCNTMLNLATKRSRACVEYCLAIMEQGN